ncbi:Protein kinase domain-containing protein [Mycena indigotica]|uniref:Protein kinase domain-containing protein n=1 Tax=Mycena indigotica TaxID=2126181 RepID=A0A8H6SQK4_9AGAR|nr:Protein kinase domain-containing protein [Mycena indigotica]KAF7304003.1 Protein kinase domain-containing protein [Mycena indigotica]
MTLDLYPHSPLPAYLEPWELLDADPRTAHLVDTPWRYFERYLATRGYYLCWRYYSRTEPETAFRGGAFHYPIASNPFRPRLGEAFVNLCDMDESAHRRGGIHQTTGWMTQAATLKMAYDAQDRVCALKALHNTRSRTEIDIMTFLNSPKLRHDPANHTIPMLDQLATKEWTFIAMPYWPRSVQACIPWEVDDYFERLEQALEGLAFMHRHGVVHRDISPTNMLLNFHTPSGIRDVYTPLTRRNIKLSFIDFGCAARFPAGPGSNHLDWTGSGYCGTGEHIAPEVGKDRRYRLTPVDVYALGSVFIRALSWEQLQCATFGNPSSLPVAAHQLLTAVPKSQGFGYLALLDQMTHLDPMRRPTAQTALEMCREMREALDEDVRWAPVGGYRCNIFDDGRSDPRDRR